VLITDISCSTYQFAINRRSLPGNYRPYLVCSAIIWSILPRDAMLSAYMPSSCIYPSVCLSMCVCVCHTLVLCENG